MSDPLARLTFTPPGHHPLDLPTEEPPAILLGHEAVWPEGDGEADSMPVPTQLTEEGADVLPPPPPEDE